MHSGLPALQILPNFACNHHFLPRVEQRLNAANPHAAAKNQRIYSFEIIDREAHALRLQHARGVSIVRNLALDNLFTFDTPLGNNLQWNFEHLFQRYERTVEVQTRAVLAKVSAGNTAVGTELVELFAKKLLNFARNPFSVVKMLNTFGVLAAYEPTEPKLKQAFYRILNGRRPHQERICRQIGISDNDYVNWLKVLFMLFMEYGDGDASILDGTVNSLFLSEASQVQVLLCTYTTESCLLSDRSFTTPGDRNDVTIFDFNLCANAFVRYGFADIDSFIPPNTPQHVIADFKRLRTPTVYLTHLVDDKELLRRYNQCVVWQSHRHVYSSRKDRLII